MPTDCLPSLDDFITIDQQQIEEFRTKGHTLIKGVLRPDEVPLTETPLMKRLTNTIQKKEHWKSAILTVKRSCKS